MLPLDFAFELAFWRQVSYSFSFLLCDVLGGSVVLIRPVLCIFVLYDCEFPSMIVVELYMVGRYP